MVNRRLVLGASLSCLMLSFGCSDDSPTTTAAQPEPATEVAPDRPKTGLLGRTRTSTNIDTSPMSQPPADNVTVEVVGLTGTKPAVWIWKPPTRTMRKANFIIPAPEGSEAAELVINHFPEAAGNTLDANIARWSKQFRTIDGGTPIPSVDSFEADSMKITTVELHGEYMGMGGHWHKANHAMLMAVVEAPAGTVFIKMIGPDDTVEAHREGYMDYIKSLRKMD